MNPLTESLQVLERALGETVTNIFDTDAVQGLPDRELLTLMATAARIVRRAEAVLVEGTGQIEDRSDTRDRRLTARMGCRSVNELVQRVTLTSRLTATGYERAAHGVREEIAPSSGQKLPAQYPAMRAAMIEGAVGADGLIAVLTPLSQLARSAGREALLAADAELAGSARGEGTDAAPPASAEHLRALAQIWAVYLDQDGTEPREAAAARKRGLSLGTARDGLIPVRGQLLPEVAAQLQRIFDCLLNPKLDGPHFTHTDTDIDGDGVVPDQADLRTRVQKQHDALGTALTVAARTGDLPTIGGAAPTLVVSVRAEDLATGTGYAQIEGTDQPVPLAVARHTACHGTVQRVLMGENGRILSIGVLDRVFTSAQRKAITLRDGGCLIPGCQVPASWCEIHHVHEHATGGPTHTDNGVLLCWHHHRTLDSNGWAIRMHHGTPEVRGPTWWDPDRRWRPTTTSPTRMLTRLETRRQ